ncbi:hypothetical protein OESDEN_08315 [Oesophagostomum dentatum]|uniref:Uncharacterized protein n=1 Tax=Oesophagostomum dentatum TaxID=61180 RepID=A0A0B1T7M8_OESDE|nr:hypothetical protein OESDEN_08315 [Oesophagostomum dentatum]
MGLQSRKKASKGEQPTDDAFQLTVKSTLPTGISPKVYIEVYPWIMYSMEVKSYKKFGCYVKEKPNDKDVAITCQFSE